MNSTRGVVACALVAVIVLGPLTDALGQQPAPPPAAPPAVVVETVSPEPPPPARGRDIYDVGAGVVTVVRAPGAAALCILGSVAGTVLFLLTFGTAQKGAARAFEEGCAQKWIVSGDDLRPRMGPGMFSDRSTDFNRDRR